MPSTTTRPPRRRAAKNDNAQRYCSLIAEGRRVRATVTLQGVEPRPVAIDLPQAEGLTWEATADFDGKRWSAGSALPATFEAVGDVAGPVHNDLLVFRGGSILLENGSALPFDREVVAIVPDVDVAGSTLRVEGTSENVVTFAGVVRNRGFSVTRTELSAAVDGPGIIVPGSLRVAGATYTDGCASVVLGAQELTAVRFAVALTREDPDATAIVARLVIATDREVGATVAASYELVRRPVVMVRSLRILGPTAVAPGEPVTVEVALRNDGGAPALEVPVAIRVSQVGRFALAGVASSSFAYDPAEGHTLHAIVEAIAPFGNWTGTLKFVVPVDHRDGSVIDVVLDAAGEHVCTSLRVEAAPRADASRCSLILVDAAGERLGALRCAEPFSARVTITNAGDGVARVPRVILDLPAAVELIESVGAALVDGELRFGALAPQATAEATLRLQVREVADDLRVGALVVMDEAPAYRMASVPLHVDVAARFLACSWNVASPTQDTLPVRVEAVNRGDGAAASCVLQLELPDAIEIVPTAVAVNGHRVRREEDARKLAGDGIRLTDVGPGTAIALDVELRRTAPGEAWRGTIATVLTYGTETLRSERRVTVPGLETSTLGFGIDVDVVAAPPPVLEVVAAIETVGFEAAAENELLRDDALVSADETATVVSTEEAAPAVAATGVPSADAVDADAVVDTQPATEVVGYEHIGSSIRRPVYDAAEPTSAATVEPPTPLDAGLVPRIAVALGALLGPRTLQTIAQRLALLTNSGHAALYRHALVARLFAPTMGVDGGGASEIVAAVREWEDRARFTTVNKCVMAEINGPHVDVDFETPDQRETLKLAAAQLQNVDIFQPVEGGYTSALTTAEVAELVRIADFAELGGPLAAKAWALLMVAGSTALGDALTAYRAALVEELNAAAADDTRDRLGSEASPDLERALQSVIEAVSQAAELAA